MWIVLRSLLVSASSAQCTLRPGLRLGLRCAEGGGRLRPSETAEDGCIGWWAAPRPHDGLLPPPPLAEGIREVRAAVSEIVSPVGRSDAGALKRTAPLTSLPRLLAPEAGGLRELLPPAAMWAPGALSGRDGGESGSTRVGRRR